MPAASLDLRVPDPAVGDEADAGGVALEDAHAGVDEQRDELLRDEARAGDVDEDDVRLDRLRVEHEAWHRTQPVREHPRAPVVVRDSLLPAVQGDERRGGGDSRPVDARSADPLQHQAPALDDRLAPGEHCAHRRPDALVERERDGVGRRGERSERDAECDRSVDESRSVEVHAAVVALRGGGERLRVLDRQHRAARARMRVLEHEQRCPHLGDELVDLARIHPPVALPERDGIEPGELRDSEPFGGEHVRGGLEDDGVAALAEREERDEVRHPAGRHPERRRLPEQLCDPGAELVHRGVLPEGRPAELGCAHRLPHLRGRHRAKVRAEVDHRRRRCLPGRAPVCAPSVTTCTPFTSTCSTPRA